MASKINEFYNKVFVENRNNSFTVRNKFLAWWTNPTIGLTDTTFMAGKASKISEIVSTMNDYTLYIDNIDVPELNIRGGKEIDEGRGTFFVFGDAMVTPKNNEFSIAFRETQSPLSEFIAYWMQFNARPWVRPFRMNLSIDFISDNDGETPLVSYIILGCAPKEVDTINASYDNREIMLRASTFGFNMIKSRNLFGNKGQYGPFDGMENFVAANKRLR